MSHNENFQHPLHFAVRMNRPKMVALLLELGADPLAKDGSGYTSVVYATEPGAIARCSRRCGRGRSRPDRCPRDCAIGMPPRDSSPRITARSKRAAPIQARSISWRNETTWKP